jgi:hypothetical protein
MPQTAQREGRMTLFRTLDDRELADAMTRLIGDQCLLVDQPVGVNSARYAIVGLIRNPQKEHH